MSTSSQFGGGVKSVQRGTIMLVGTSNTATITAVTTGKSMMNKLGERGAAVDVPSQCTTLYLTNSTTVTAERAAANGTGYVSYEVIEFY